MNLRPLLARVATTPVLERAVRDVQSGGRARIGALIDAARPLVAATLRVSLGGSMIVIAGHPHRAQHLADELAAWLGHGVEVFPAFETLPYEHAPVDRETLARRQAIVDRLAREELVVVASVRALLQPVSAPARNTRTLRAGLQVAPDQLAAEWVDGGYEPVPLVDMVGTFARRGGVLDVFPIGAHYPVRIEFLGREIESLRSFDPTTQRSLGPLEIPTPGTLWVRIASVDVPPMASLDRETLAVLREELRDIDIGNLTAEARALWEQDLAQLEAGLVGDSGFFTPYLNGSMTLLDVAARSEEPRPLLILEDGHEIPALAHDLTNQATELQRDLVDRGEIPAGLLPALLPMEALDARLAAARSVELSAGGDERDVEDRIFVQPRAYGGRVRDFLQALEASNLSDIRGSSGLRARALVITSYQHARLHEMLDQEGIGAAVVDDLETVPEPGTITIVRGSLAAGWDAPALGLCLYTDHEIFGWSKPHVTPRRKRAPREAFFSELTPGDYVVHVEHGIGQLQGTTHMTDEGAEREYLIVQYAGTDRLYVPSDQLDRLTRYVGMGDAKPQLSKLGGAEWMRAKSRAKQAAQDIAEELIALYARREAIGGHAFLPDTPWQRELDASFPFEETPDQRQAIADVKADLELKRAMDRLVVADVGYGKTEVAVRAAFKVVMDGKQVALLVPTTVLAQQHLDTFRERLEAFPVRIEALSRFRSPAEQRDVLRRLVTGEVDIIIGTHRLLSKDVAFKDLGLLVVDEEQRFGVRHKERLKLLRQSVDVLTLTATPIPRTLHMSLSGIRDVSIIQTPPEGRLPIKTYLQPYNDLLVREAIIRELERDGQVYFVHNRVASIEALAEKLRRLVPEARTLVGHGQMPEDLLEKVMLAFAHGEADVLLCSTIIESGLDIPNVNTIVIDHADKLGLAQLYQLRGRVGRGVNQAYAYLLYPRDARLSHDALRRMEAVFEATELGAGFRIAMADLEIRGAGNLLGAQQSGHVAAVGFDLYTSLLKEAVDRLRGEPVEERANVTVELPFDVLIPAAYVADERERLALYRRIAVLHTPEEIRALEDEIRDRFGPPPQSVHNLLQQVRVKLLAERAHVALVVLRGDTLVIKGATPTHPYESPLHYDRVALYRRFGMQARITDSTLRIPRRALGEDWLGAIRDILEETLALRDNTGSRRTEAAATSG